MTRLLHLLLTCLMLSGAALAGPLDGDAGASGKFLPVEEAFRPSASLAGGQLVVHWDIAPGYYLYQKSFKTRRSDGGTLPSPRLAGTGVSHVDPTFGQVVIYRDGVELLLPPPDRPLAAGSSISVRYQGCADAGLCYPPETWTVPIDLADWAPDERRAARAPDSADAGSLAGWLAAASLPLVIATFLVMGLGLAFTPCVLPMLPILSVIITGQSGSTARSGLRLAAAYVLGMTVVYTAAGLLIASLGAAMNLSAIMQRPAVLIPLAALFTLLSSILATGRELRLPGVLREPLERWQREQQGGSLIPVFVMGAISSLIVSPCVSAPLAGILIFLASSQDLLLGGSALFSLGLGMGIPLLVLGAGGGRWLPKAGPWLEDIKRLFAWLLLLVATSLITRLLPASQHLFVWAGFLGFSALALWRDRRPGARLLLLGLLLGSGWLVQAGRAGGTDPLRPWVRDEAAHPGAGTAFQRITDPSALDAAVQRALAAGRPVIVDVFAEWCVSCIEMERKVLPLADIAKRLQPAERLKLDITEATPAQLAWLQREGIFGPPAYLAWHPDGRRHPPLIGESSADRFIAFLENAWN